MIKPYSITDKNRVEKYFASKRLNVSTLKGLDNPVWIKIKRMNKGVEDEEKRAFRVGSVVDTMNTDIENFDNEFIVIGEDRPTGLMLKFIEALPEGLTKDSDITLYKEAHKKAEFKTKIETVVKKFWSEKRYVKYYHAVRNTHGKTLITKDEYDEAKTCKDGLFNNPYTRPYFDNTDPYKKVFYQVPLYFTHMGIMCKGLMDLLLINYKDKVIEILDLKTTGRSISSFPRDYVSYKYYLQGTHYEIGLTKLLNYKFFKDQLGITDDIENWTIEHMKFIVVEKKGNAPARLFQMGEKEFEVAMYGKDPKGYIEYMELYKWHEKTGLWDYPKEMYESNGIIQLTKLQEIVSNKLQEK